MGQRRDILAVHVNSLNIAQDVSLDMLAEITHGYVGADFAALCREASFMAIEKLNPQFAKVGSAVVVTMSDFKSAMNRITPSVQRGSDVFVDFNPISWQNIGGLEEVKAQLKQAVEWPMKHPKSFIRLGIHHPKGVLLYGPPGCCKTTLVRAAATACNAAFLSINAAQLYSPFVGDSEKTIAQVFHQARLCAPAILFLDELDTIVGKRSMESGHGNSVHERVLSALLNEMDGIGTTLQERRDPEKRMMEGELHDNVGISHMEHYEITDNNVLVVGATNRPDLLDSALLRPGRMDRIIYVPPPDSQTRHQILRVHTRHSPLATDVNLQEISAKTELYSGADLENLCRE
uniref:Spermatogenesis-associated protein 5-like protein 1-like n=1 Tax=Saccoglossus kowalevskii TaxID=10224 RepID=A0ABM0MML0_SACKO